MKRNNGGDTDRKGLRKLVKEMSGLTKAELLTIPGMEIKRVDLILSGAILLEECMDALGANSFTTTGYSLRDGILEREMRLMRRQGKGQTYFNLDDLFRKARRLGSNVGHLKQVCHLAESLFDATKRLHRLDPIWKRYLSAAAILHDVGEAISPIHHEMHSYYVVRHGDFLSMENWESEFIARLCLHHNGTPGTLNKKDLNFTEEKAKKLAFVKLLALLRVADGLDRGHQSSLKIKSVRIEKQKISLTLSGGGPIDLDILRAEQKKALFEETFRRELVIHKSG